MRKVIIQNQITLMDDNDYEKFKDYHWNIVTNDKCQYICRYIKNENGKYEVILFHRFILNVPKDKETDHINLNGLDNRRENLRIATHSQNMANRRLNKNNTSGFKGVSYFKKTKKWKAEIRVDKRKKFLGYFNSKIDAAKIYDEMATKYFGEFAKTNKALKLLEKITL